ncbi:MULTISPECIES: DUF1127 domain-containing protein [unclassified Aureimonas]|nr:MULTISPECIES: DUF1127 domain-containing protein [unclassified Aureimonas]
MFRFLTSEIQNFRAQRKSINLLRGMSDHALADIGVSRGDISRAVRHGRG